MKPSNTKKQLQSAIDTLSRIRISEVTPLDFTNIRYAIRALSSMLPVQTLPVQMENHPISDLTNEEISRFTKTQAAIYLSASEMNALDNLSGDNQNKLYSKVNVIKDIRTRTGCHLSTAKYLCDIYMGMKVYP